MAVYQRTWTTGDGKKRSNYFFKFMIDGVTYKETVKGARTKAQAERAEVRRKEEVYSGKYRKADNSPRLADFVEQVYLPWAKDNKRTA